MPNPNTLQNVTKLTFGSLGIDVIIIIITSSPKTANKNLIQSILPSTICSPERHGPDASKRKTTGGALSDKNCTHLKGLKTERRHYNYTKLISRALQFISPFNTLKRCMRHHCVLAQAEAANKKESFNFLKCLLFIFTFSSAVFLLTPLFCIFKSQA